MSHYHRFSGRFHGLTSQHYPSALLRSISSAHCSCTSGLKKVKHILMHSVQHHWYTLLCCFFRTYWEQSSQCFSSCSSFWLELLKKSEGQDQRQIKKATVVNQKRAAEASGLQELGTCSCSSWAGKNKCEVNASTGYFAPDSCLSGSKKKGENRFWRSNHGVTVFLALTWSREFF